MWLVTAEFFVKQNAFVEVFKVLTASIKAYKFAYFGQPASTGLLGGFVGDSLHSFLFLFGRFFVIKL